MEPERAWLMLDTTEVAAAVGEPGVAGAIWRLEPDERELDANVIALPAGGGIAEHVGGDLDVLIHVVAGSGSLRTDGGEIALEPGALVYLPHRSRRAIVAGPGGLRYLSVHKRKQNRPLMPTLVGDARPSASTSPARVDDVLRISSLAELEDLLGFIGERLYLRYSGGPEADATEQSVDKESGCPLPGLSVNPLNPEPWWSRPTSHWLARQLQQYAHVGRREGRAGWVLTGRVVGRGPDCEPLLADTRHLGVVTDRCLEQAAALYHEGFDVDRV